MILPRDPANHLQKKVSNPAMGDISLIGAVMACILVADNRVVIRAGLRALLQTRSDFLVCGEARDGREAIDLALQKKPDIVVINVNMPVVNGIEATRQIRQASPGTEVLIYTEENDDDLIREALRAGARGYLLESAGDEEVIEAIAALARHCPFYSSVVSERLLHNMTQRVRGDSSGVRLTGREQEIVRLIAEGHRGRHIAQMLRISKKTVDTHRTAAMRKLQLQSVAEVVRYAVRENLIHA
jgi:DNA-binding NarL/FixJ family response regulator